MVIGIMFDLSLFLILYFVYRSSEDSGETAQMIVFLKEFFEMVNFERVSRRSKSISIVFT